WQFAPAGVTGLEADFQGLSNNHDTDSITLTTTAVGFPDTFVSTTTVTKQVDWLGTVRGRLGVLAAPSLLIYGTGGLAYGEAKASTTVAQTATCIFSCLNPPINYGTTASFSETRVGWTVGAGLEWMFAPRWTVRSVLRSWQRDLESSASRRERARLSRKSLLVRQRTVVDAF